MDHTQYVGLAHPHLSAFAQLQPKTRDSILEGPSVSLSFHGAFSDLVSHITTLVWVKPVFSVGLPLFPHLPALGSISKDKPVGSESNHSRVTPPPNFCGQHQPEPITALCLVHIFVLCPQLYLSPWRGRVVPWPSGRFPRCQAKSFPSLPPFSSFFFLFPIF